MILAADVSNLSVAISCHCLSCVFVMCVYHVCFSCVFVMCVCHVCLSCVFVMCVCHVCLSCVFVMCVCHKLFKKIQTSVNEVTQRTFRIGLG